MLTAVEMWTKRDHQAEWNQWLSAINTITERVTKIDGVTTSIAGSRDELRTLRRFSRSSGTRNESASAERQSQLISRVVSLVSSRLAPVTRRMSGVFPSRCT